MRRLVALVVLTVSLVAVPVGASAVTAWLVHRVAGISVALPSTWADAGGERGRILAESKRLARDDPSLARQLDGLLAAGDASAAVRLLAVDLDRTSLRSGFVTNLSVIYEKTSLPFAEWRRRSLQALTASPFVRQPVWSEVVRLPAGKALRLRYRASFAAGARRLEVAITQYGVVKPGAAIVLTYTTSPSLAGRYRSTFERSARSLALRLRS